jgi:DNA-binding NarL/FixJ family response regulator
LAKDHTIVRQGLRLLVEADGDIGIVGEAKKMVRCLPNHAFLGVRRKEGHEAR